jgi:tetratricopeptide (TPR) repeat protein
MSIRVSALAAVLAVCSCSSLHPPSRDADVPPPPLYRTFFETGTVEVGQHQAALFELPESVVRDLDREITTLRNEEARYRALRRWIFRVAEQYEYDPAITASLAELDDLGKINCFSFSLLFLAAARHVDVPAVMQLVYTPPDWQETDGTWVLNQHVNVSGTVARHVDREALSSRHRMALQTGTLIRPNAAHASPIRYVVDLNPRVVVHAHRTRLLADHEIVGLFYSNKAAEAIFMADYTSAYHYSKLALNADRSSGTAWNNLGIYFSRTGQLEHARDAYLTAIAVDPDADSSRNNLVSVLRQLGDVERAAALDQQARARRSRNPYYHYGIGRQRLDARDYAASIAHFRSAIRRKRDEQRFYLSLAEAQLALGQHDGARQTLKRAARFLDTDQQGRYNALRRELRIATGGDAER